MNRKTVVLKDFSVDDAGAFKALFAPYNVVDKQGDLTMPGAFGSQAVIISGYGHASWREGVDALPVGKGRIFDGDVGGIVEGKFFLDTISGSETYKVVKNLGELQEWSYALPEIESEMQTIDGKPVRILKRITVNEVSPVLMGAGIGTRTLEVKKAIASHTTATDGGSWDSGVAVRHARGGEPSAYYRKVFAWEDPDGDPSVKSTYKFPHHFVSEDGTPGAASTRACSSGIAVLNGGRGGANIPDGDRPGVYRHLAKHLKDSGQEEIPELRSIDVSVRSMPIMDHLELVLEDVTDMTMRIEDVAEKREVQDRHPAEATIKRALAVKAALDDLSRRLGTIGEKHDAAYAEVLKFYQKQTRIREAVYAR